MSDTAELTERLEALQQRLADARRLGSDELVEQALAELEALGARRPLPIPEDDLSGDDRSAAVELAEAELAEVNERLSQQLRRLHPELFDADGHLIEAEYRRALSGQGGTGKLTRAEILRTEKERQRPTDGARSVDAS